MSYFTWAFGIWTTAVVVVSFKTYSFSGECTNKHGYEELYGRNRLGSSLNSKLMPPNWKGTRTFKVALMGR